MPRSNKTTSRGFEDLQFHPGPLGTTVVGAIMHFGNGFGVSVIRGMFTYGGREGLYELAVIDAKGNLRYDTPITQDVEGYLTPAGVTRIMGQVQGLPREEK